MGLNDANKFVYNSYNKNFKAYFLKEKKKLEAFLPKDSRIEHIGSTSIQGLGGKGIIDILIIVSKKDLKKCFNLIKENNYNYYGKGKNKPERDFFDKIYRYGGKKRYVHLHLTYTGSIEGKKQIALRDYLKSNPNEAKKYSIIKKKAIKYSNGDRLKYLNFKKEFLKKLNQKAMGFYLNN